MPPRAVLEDHRRRARRGFFVTGAVTLLLLALTVCGYWTLAPGEDDMGAAMSACLALVLLVATIVFGRRWWAASNALKQQEGGQ